MLTLCNCDINYSCKCLTSTLCKCVTFIYHLECLLSWFVFFKLILEQLFSDIQFLTLISTLLEQMLHTLYIPLSSCCLTLRTLLCLLLVLMYKFFCLLLEKPDFQHFFPQVLLSKAQRMLGIWLTHKSVNFCFADSCFPSSTNTRRWSQRFCS